MSTVVLFSGGLDSTVLLTLALSREKVFPLTINYGSRHNAREMMAALEVCNALGIAPPTLIHLPHNIFSSSFTRGEIPNGHYQEETMKSTICPNRNMVLLSVAGAFAASRKANTVMYAAHGGDHYIYPDCTPKFIEECGRTLFTATEGAVSLSAPFMNMTKAEIVQLGLELGAPLARSYSCYHGREKHCGRCGTCVERAEAFSLAGALDPTEYEDPDFWRTVTKGGKT